MLTFLCGVALVPTSQVVHGPDAVHQFELLQFESKLSSDRVSSDLAIYSPSRKLLWKKRFAGERVSNAVYLDIKSARSGGFLVVTKGLAGNRFRVLFLYLRGGAIEEALNVRSMGLPYFPGIELDKDRDPIFVVWGFKSDADRSLVQRRYHLQGGRYVLLKTSAHKQ